MVSLVQLFAISIYMILKGYHIADIEAEARSLIAVRSILYCVSFTAFVFTLRGLNPISAILALHSGLICMTVIIRLVYLKQLFFTLTAGKMWVTVTVLTFALYPGISVVDEADFDD